jgi:hypothetical protein
MLCCAITNLVYKIRIHTKDGCDNDNNSVDQDQMMNRTDKERWTCVKLQKEQEQL